MNFSLHFTGDYKHAPIEVTHSIVLLGRHPECDVRLKVSSVSRRHCCLVEVDHQLFVRDLGSLHGVWVNGCRVIEHRLNPGDEMAIGPVFLRVGEEGFGKSEQSLQAGQASDCSGISGSDDPPQEMDSDVDALGWASGETPLDSEVADSPEMQDSVTEDAVVPADSQHRSASKEEDGESSGPMLQFELNL